MGEITCAYKFWLVNLIEELFERPRSKWDMSKGHLQEICEDVD
jgi:hypothetical protein